MGLFDKFKKKEVKEECCSCCNCNSESVEKASKEINEDASVKILGSGCKKCNELEKATKEALDMLNMNDTIDHVTDFAKIAAYGVISTPALVVDEKVVSYGKVLKTDEVLKILKKIR